jgi:hypothetical protein
MAMKRDTFAQSSPALPSPKQLEFGFVFLKTIRDFGFSTQMGISFTEVAKHLFVAKQSAFEVRVPFDYPAKYPTSPGQELDAIFEGFISGGLVKRTYTTEGAFFKITPAGMKTLEELEDLLEISLSGSDIVASLEELHRKEELIGFKSRDRSRTPTQELQKRVVDPLMLELLVENRVFFVDPSLKSLNRSDLIAPAIHELGEEEVKSASETTVDCLKRYRRELNVGKSENESIKKGEIEDFVKKLMYGLAKFNNNGFLAKAGELALFYAPIRHSGKSKNGETYVVGTRYRRKMMLRLSGPLKFDFDSRREVFVLAYVQRDKIRALALGIPGRFYEELVFRFVDYREETLERILSVVRPHLNMWNRNRALRKFYESMQIRSEDAPEEAVAKILLWLKLNVSIQDVPQLKIDDPYSVFEKIIEKKITKGYVNNCKEFVALLAILTICLPISRHPKIFIQLCAVRSGRNHVRLCMELENGSIMSLDPEYYPEAKVIFTYQLGGKRS